jgi:hypothetical protein
MLRHLALALLIPSSILWSVARRPFLSAAQAISTGKDGLRSAGSLIRRRIEARLRDALFVFVLAMAGLVLGLAGGVFLLMALWRGLAAVWGPIGASLSLGIALLGGSVLPLVMAVRRATTRHRAGD